MRLNNGVYGQRQGGTAQMVRIKLPAGSISPEQLDSSGISPRPIHAAGATSPRARTCRSTSSSSTKVTDVMRALGAVGLTTREACGDTVRNVMACHLAGACPHELPRRDPLGRGRVPPLRAQPARPTLAAEVQDQLLRLLHRLRPGDVQRRRRDRRVADPRRRLDEAGFRVYIAGGLGANPHPALALEDFTHAKTCCRRSKPCCGSSIRPATATTSCGPG